MKHLKVLALIITFLYTAQGATLAQEELPSPTQFAEGIGSIDLNIIGSFEQASVGILNYGYLDNVYAQLTNDYDTWGDGFSPTSSGKNISYTWIDVLGGSEYIKGFGWNLEYANYTSTSSSTINTDQTTVIAPSIIMNLNTFNFGMRLYFKDLIREPFQPYFGLGYGYIQGSFDIEKALSQDAPIKTNFWGISSYRVLGANLRMNRFFGVNIEYRGITATEVGTSNDPWDVQAQQENPDKKWYLDFSGTMLNVTAYMRF